MRNIGQDSSQDEKKAWEKFKSLRNKVNNKKKNEEHLYKKQKVNENITDSSKTWNTIKQFMDWKVKGSPSQILVGNKLHKKASEVASIMNEYFISKINDLRSNFSIQNPDLRGCYKAKNSKKCSLSLEFVSVKDVERIIKNLRSSKAVSIDGLDSYSIRISA